MSKAQLRASQLVTSFGPGAMLDLPDASVIIGGLDHWKYDPAQITEIHEARLVAKLKRILNVSTLTLRAPPPAADQDHGVQPDIVAWRFPEWFIVQHTDFTRAGFRRRRLVHSNSLVGEKYPDPDTRKKESVVPVRFVRACRRGHIGDVDWKAFVHSARSDCTRQLWFEERGTSGDLDEMWVICECGAQRAMSNAARMDLRSLGSCNGARPWLGAGSHEPCGEPNRLLIRSASNAYFSQKLAVISIPDLHKPVEDTVRSLWDDFLGDVETVEEVIKVRRKPTPSARLHGIADADVLAAIERIRSGISDYERPVKAVEFEALAEARAEIGADVPDGDFYARALPVEVWQSLPWMQAFDRVVLVHRLREVVAQVGFTRFEAIGTDIQGELTLDVQPASLSLNQTWLPAVENRGEGIFLAFKPDAIRVWLQKPAVAARAQKLVDGFDMWKREHENSSREFPGMAFFMLHSFSHLLLSVISLECGYPASSLRERVYADPTQEHYGVLIYTGSSDAEGTLGGLIASGRDIQQHVHRAQEQGTLCSNDPICAYHTPEEHDQQPLLGSACHGCLLISETSCEQHNDFLDRALVVPTVEDLGCEFFENLV